MSNTNESVCLDCQSNGRAFAWLFRVVFAKDDAIRQLNAAVNLQHELHEEERQAKAKRIDSAAMTMLFRAVAGVPCPAEVSEEGIKHITDVIGANPCLIDLAEQLKAMKDGIAGQEAELMRAHELADNRRLQLIEVEEHAGKLELARLAAVEECERWKEECSRLASENAKTKPAADPNAWMRVTVGGDDNIEEVKP